MFTAEQRRNIDTMAAERSTLVSRWQREAMHIEDAHRHDGIETYLVMEFLRIVAILPTLERATHYARLRYYPAEARALS